MTDLSRFALRLRRRALRCYELGMFAMLVALALSAGLPASGAPAAPAAAQCGNIQSSTVVMQR